MTIKKFEHIVVIGAGSIGCYIGGLLSKVYTHKRVSLIARPTVVEQLKTHGLHTSDYTGLQQSLSADELTLSIEDSPLKKADLILVCVKNLAIAEVCQQITQSGNTQALVLSLQNGVSHIAYMRKHLANTVLATVVGFNVVSKGEGKFHRGTEGHLLCAESPHTAVLNTLFSHAELDIQFSDNVESLLWSKLMLNLNNPINALSGLPLKQQLSIHAYRQILKRCLQEGLAVCKAANIPIQQMTNVPPKIAPYALAMPDWLYKIIAKKMLDIDPEARSSMAEDLDRKRQTEIDYINGEVVKLGKEMGIATPVNSHICTLMKTAEQAKQGSPKLSATALNPV